MREEKQKAFIRWCVKEDQQTKTISDAKFDIQVAEKLLEDEDYMILTDDEADDMYNDYLDNYIEECILDQIPDNLRFYFDDDRFKNDCKLEGGRGYALASYDGHEHEYYYNGTTYYIYRLN